MASYTKSTPPLRLDDFHGSHDPGAIGVVFQDVNARRSRRHGNPPFASACFSSGVAAVPGISIAVGLSRPHGHGLLEQRLRLIPPGGRAKPRHSDEESEFETPLTDGKVPGHQRPDSGRRYVLDLAESLLNDGAPLASDVDRIEVLRHGRRPGTDLRCPPGCDFQLADATSLRCVPSEAVEQEARDRVVTLCASCCHLRCHLRDSRASGVRQSPTQGEALQALREVAAAGLEPATRGL